MGALAYEERYSVKDYEQWEGDWELIYGDAYAMSPSPRFTHQMLSFNIAKELNDLLENCPSCEVVMEMDWNISDDTVVRPDIMVVCNQDGERVVKAPLLIFEVASKGSAKRDEVLKFDLYRIEGVKFYGIAYPEYKKVRFYFLDEDKYKKLGDFTNESYEIEIESCKMEIDFKKFWRRKTN